MKPASAQLIAVAPGANQPVVSGEKTIIFSNLPTGNDSF
jgi:hypothetical protein